MLLHYRFAVTGVTMPNTKRFLMGITLLFLMIGCASKPAKPALNLSRTTGLGLTYDSSREAFLDMRNYFMSSWDMPSPGFRYLDFDNYGSQSFYKLTVNPTDDYETSIYDVGPDLERQIAELYERGVKTQGFIEDNLKRRETRVNAKVCPDIPQLFEKITQAFEENIRAFKLGSRGGLYTDSPRVDRYFYSGAPSEVIELDMTEDKTALFRSTSDFKNYVEQCAKVAGYVKQY